MKKETVSSAIAAATRQLAGSGVASAPLDAAVLLGHVLGMERGQLIASQDKELDNKELSDFNALALRRSKHEPLAYIIGKKEFWSLDFYVTSDTLIPRPDSETLVSAALERVKNRAKPIALLDIGTGTGCLLIALLKELPRAEAIGVDNNQGAVQVAQENARRHNVSDRSRFLKSHWCDAVNGTFDLILSNPPYIAESAYAALMPDVAQYEPKGALLAGADGLDAYRALAPQVAARLNQGGMAVFEVGQGQAKDVAELLRNEGLKTETENDLAGITRCVIARKE